MYIHVSKPQESMYHTYEQVFFPPPTIIEHLNVVWISVGGSTIIYPIHSDMVDLYFSNMCGLFVTI